MCERTESLNEDIPDSVLLKYAVLDLKKARVKIGQLESYIKELEYKLDNINKEHNEVVEKRNKKIIKLKNKCKDLRAQIYELNYELSKHKSERGFQDA